MCQDNPDGGDQFCFKFEEDIDHDVNHTKPSRSEYWFGKQRRRVPEQPSRVLPLYNATQNCEFYCNEKLGGMLAQKMDGTAPVDTIVSYDYLDDMCSTCE